MAYKLLEQQVEARIISAISDALTAAGVSDFGIVGFLTPTAAGTVKENLITGIGVQVAPRANVSQGSPIIKLRCEITLVVGTDASANGELYFEVETAVMRLLESWHNDFDSALTTLTVEGVFRADGFLFTDGGSRAYDTTSKSWVSVLPFELAGVALVQTEE